MSNTELILTYLLTINLYAELEREIGTFKPYLLSLEDLSSELAALIISRGLGAQGGRSTRLRLLQMSYSRMRTDYGHSKSTGERAKPR